MPDSVKCREWSQVVNLIVNAIEQNSHHSLLSMLLTHDEREALIARVNIFHELLQGDLSQRQISQLLKVGVATITRGSNELKSCTESEKIQLMALLEETLSSSK